MTVLFSLFLVFLQVPGEPAHSRFEYFRILMGTKVRIVLYAPDESRAMQAATAAFDRIHELERIMTDYDPESELMSLARGEQAVSPDLFAVLRRSQEMSRITRGAFDITVGSLVKLWRRARRDGRLPDPDSLSAARASVGYGHVRLDARNRTVSLRRAMMRLDLGGIGKGFAVDQALALLRSRGIRSALVDAGGDIGVSDAPPGRAGWHIDAVDPVLGSASLVLERRGISTSGDLEQFVEIDGVRYSHIVDPRTGLGVRHTAAVTVVAPDAATADAAATALNVLSPSEGVRLVESQPDWAAFCSYRTDAGLRRFVSSRMKALLNRVDAACGRRATPVSRVAGPRVPSSGARR